MGYRASGQSCPSGIPCVPVFGPVIASSHCWALANPFKTNTRGYVHASYQSGNPTLDIFHEVAVSDGNTAASIGAPMTIATSQKDRTRYRSPSLRPPYCGIGFGVTITTTQASHRLRKMKQG